jgi:methionine-rich copper-binding protein CopC
MNTIDIPRRVRRGALATLVAGGLLAGAAATAYAHTDLERTSPANRAVVKNLPTTVKLTFAEPIASVTSVRVLHKGRTNRTKSFRLNPRNAAQVLARTTGNQQGRYRVTWKVVGADGHHLQGSFGFKVER